MDNSSNIFINFWRLLFRNSKKTESDYCVRCMGIKKKSHDSLIRWELDSKEVMPDCIWLSISDMSGQVMIIPTCLARLTCSKKQIEMAAARCANKLSAAFLPPTTFLLAYTEWPDAFILWYTSSKKCFPTNDLEITCQQNHSFLKIIHFSK